MKKLIVIIFIVLCGAPLSALADDTVGSCARAGGGAFQTTQTYCSAAGGTWTANSSTPTPSTDNTTMGSCTGGRAGGTFQATQGNCNEEGGTWTANPTPATQTPSSNVSTPCGDKCNLTYTPLEPLPNVDYSAITGAHGLSNLVNTIFTILIVVGALLAVLMLTIGGFEYMLANTVALKIKGREKATAALFGIVLIAAIWLILNTINPALLNVNLAP